MPFKMRVPAVLLAGLLGAASVLAGGAGASAASGGGAVIVFANASSVDPVYWVGNGTLGVGPQAYSYYNPNQLGSDSCVWTVANNETTVLPTTGVYQCSSQSQGQYINVVCGTGIVGSIVGASAAQVWGGPNYTGFEYQANVQAIIFAAGLGVLVAQANDTNHDGAAGVVQITPRNPANTGNPGGFAQPPGANSLCVNGFNVTGTVVLTVSS